jgi:hypothetical protein
MRNQSLEFMQANFGKAGSYYWAPRTMTILLLDLPPPWRDARFQW